MWLFAALFGQFENRQSAPRNPNSVSPERRWGDGEGGHRSEYEGGPRRESPEPVGRGRGSDAERRPREDAVEPEQGHRVSLDSRRRRRRAVKDGGERAPDPPGDARRPPMARSASTSASTITRAARPPKGEGKRSKIKVQCYACRGWYHPDGLDTHQKTSEYCLALQGRQSARAQSPNEGRRTAERSAASTRGRGSGRRRQREATPGKKRKRARSPKRASRGSKASRSSPERMSRVRKATSKVRKASRSSPARTSRVRKTSISPERRSRVRKGQR